MNRVLDVLLTLTVGLVALLPCFFIALLVLLTSRGPALYWSSACWARQLALKWQSSARCASGTPVVATHLMTNPADSHLTPVGAFLRRSSLDELPQLWNVFRGDMSFVGPRPALFNQTDLIALRSQRGVDRLRPGITGLAQISGRDELPLETKAALDAEYLVRQSLLLDLRILFLTGWRVLRAGGNLALISRVS